MVNPAQYARFGVIAPHQLCVGTQIFPGILLVWWESNPPVGNSQAARGRTHATDPVLMLDGVHAGLYTKLAR